ncbi:hypothetical protein [Acinetobacter baumannii]|uniref:hypothetical protein n=1 Tax=Acinetobacter baumannii TaxID=470 RepID=UPI00129C2B86|nr:hypothetical protein [Acinetobacter baumannii]
MTISFLSRQISTLRLGASQPVPAVQGQTNRVEKWKFPVPFVKNPLVVLLPLPHLANHLHCTFSFLRTSLKLGIQYLLSVAVLRMPRAAVDLECNGDRLYAGVAGIQELSQSPETHG